MRRRLATALAQRGAILGVQIGLWLAGLLLLGCRLTDLDTTALLHLALIAGLALIAAATGSLVAQRRTPTVDQCLPLLDASSRAGGVMMVRHLPGAAAWQTPQALQPEVGYRPRRALALAAAALLFALPVALLPQRYFKPPTLPVREGVAAMTEKLQERVALAEAEELLPEPLLAAITNQLAQLTTSGDAVDPARTLEALDHIDSELSRQSAGLAEALQNEQITLQASLALTEQLSAALNSGLLSESQATAAMEAVAQFLAGATLPAGLASNLLTLTTSELTADAATLEQLARLMRSAGLDQEARLLRLSELKLIDPSSLCQQGGSCTNSANCDAALAALMNSETANEALALLCSLPGMGGVSRGPGAAPITWTTPSSREGVAFHDATLDPTHLPDYDKSRLEGLSATAPEVSDRPESTTPGALTTTATAGSSVTEPILLPRHRETVKRFFTPATSPQENP